MTNLICRVWGHRWIQNGETAVLFANLECMRCQDTEIDPSVTWDIGGRLFRLRYRLKRELRKWRHWLYDPCGDCGRVTRVCGRDVGNHKGCILF